MTTQTRTSLVGALVGLVLLGLVVAFAVGVPELTGDDATAQAADAGEGAEGSAEPEDLEPIDLPTGLSGELSGELVAVDTGELPEALAAQFGDLSDLGAQQASVAEGLQALFGVPGAFRLYAASDGSALVSLTVLDKAPGLFVPEALPIDPSVLGVTRAAVEIVDIDGAICSLNWGADVPAGQPIDPAVPPQGVRCQLGDGERTYEISAQGLTPEATVELLKNIAS